MKNKDINKITGVVFLIGILVVAISIVGAFYAFGRSQFTGAGILMLSASLPITVVINWVLSNKS